MIVTAEQTCTRCLMDTTAEEIKFDEKGVCNFCTTFLDYAAPILKQDATQRQKNLETLVARIKKMGAGKAYDCIVGVSGGVDSSWVLVQAVKLGLRPLAVHMDNGWNSELAQNNIANLVRHLGVDLYTHVIEWNEYRNLMQAFFDANVIDVEVLYDNAMLAVNYNLALKHGVKFILSGCNQSSEGMSIPKNWNWFKLDKKNIKSIAKQNRVRLKTFPAIGTLGYIYANLIRKINWLSFLDYFEYNKIEVMATLQKEYGYKPYPYKHYESIFTRFYQGHILPKKFNVDKRKLHLGTLVATGQMNREDAVRDLEKIPYASEQALEDDIQYFLKKMGWTLEDLNTYLNQPGKSHLTYGSEERFYNLCFTIYKKFIKRE
ncbi:MAG: N-acetyl sugar amidotransferase [Gammaproteobacteria bacterium]|nr:N-acetyl sugar amidotransferase [Gammaproteobacteria bacterium]